MPRRTGRRVLWPRRVPLQQQRRHAARTTPRSQRFRAHVHLPRHLLWIKLRHILSQRARHVDTAVIIFGPRQQRHVCVCHGLARPGMPRPMCPRGVQQVSCGSPGGTDVSLRTRVRGPRLQRGAAVLGSGASRRAAMGTGFAATARRAFAAKGGQGTPAKTHPKRATKTGGLRSTC